MTTAFRVVNVGVNLPADAAAARLRELGGVVTKVEPPDGDPMATAAPGLYEELARGQDVVVLDLKDASARALLETLLGTADVLLTSSRPAALARLDLAAADVAARHPQLVQVAIVGHAAPDQDVAGHDLTYASAQGLVEPPALPRTLVADLGGAERAASTALALLRARDAGDPAGCAEVALADAAAFFSLPVRHGVTTEGGLLGGGYPYYGLYRASDGWIALAALEPKFRARVAAAVGGEPGPDSFRSRAAGEWARWAADEDVPLTVVIERPFDSGL